MLLYGRVRYRKCAAGLRGIVDGLQKMSTSSSARNIYIYIYKEGKKNGQEFILLRG